jgi:hypothetical protein
MVTITYDGTRFILGSIAVVQSQIDNPIINGNMEIWQRGTTFPAPATGAYSADRLKYNFVGTGVVTINRSTNVPTVAQAGVLFNYSFEVDVTTADAAIAAGDSYYHHHVIEGYNWRHFAQRAFTLSFWAMDTITGEHAVSFRNSGNDRSYVATYTINTTNTWEYKTVNVLASPSAGTWDYTTGAGIRIGFDLGPGSTFHTTAGAWQTGDFTGTATTVNSMSSTANFFRITGVKLELGNVATPIQFRSFQEELALCQRYYQKSFPYATAPAQNAGATGAERMHSQVTASISMSYSVAFSTPMVAAPTGVTYNPSAANAESRNATDSLDDSATAATATEHFLSLAFTANAANTAGDLHRIHWTADAEL